jgi:hypothetical protein
VRIQYQLILQANFQPFKFEAGFSLITRVKQNHLQTSYKLTENVSIIAQTNLRVMSAIGGRGRSG